MSNEINAEIDLGQPMVYQIRIKGHLGREWTNWFEGLTITVEDNGKTLLAGPVVDQAALHEVLKKVRDERVRKDSCGIETESGRVLSDTHAYIVHMLTGLLKPKREGLGTDFVREPGIMNMIILGGTNMSTSGITNMSAAIMTERLAEASPRLKARIAGGLYLSGVGNLFAGIVLGWLVVNGDAVATAHNILAHETLYRLAFVADFITVPCYIAVTALFYNLLKPVNRSLSLIAAFFGLAGSTLWALNDFFFLAPMVVLGGTHSLTAFKADQWQALALLFLNLHAQGSYIVMVAFGFHVILIGYLIFRSTFLPRILGVLMALAGLCYLTNSFANFLSPEFEAHLLPYILIPGGVEIVLALWLLVIGVNVQRWKEQASATGDRA